MDEIRKRIEEIRKLRERLSTERNELEQLLKKYLWRKK